MVVDGKHGNAAELFQRVSQSVKVKRYSEALNDLNAAIEADPTLSEAYFRRGSILRQLCRFSKMIINILSYFLFMCPYNVIF